MNPGEIVDELDQTGRNMTPIHPEFTPLALLRDDVGPQSPLEEVAA